MNHTQLIHDLIHELSYRVGIVDLKDKNQQSIISEILSEWDQYEAKEIILKFLNEAGKTPDENKPKSDTEGKDANYTHIGRGIYVRKGDEKKADPQKYSKDNTGSLKAITPNDYEKLKADQGEEGEKAASNTTQNKQGASTDTPEEIPQGTALQNHQQLRFCLHQNPTPQQP